MSSWSSDGNFLVYGRANAGISILELESGEEKTLNEDGKDPAWSPAENGMIAFVRPDSRDQDTIWVALPDGTQERKLAVGGWPSWSSDGNTLFYIDTTKWNVMGVAVDQPDAEPQVLGRNVHSYYPAVSPDGQSIAYQDTTGAMRIIDAASGRTFQRIEVTKNWRTILPRWSADGNRVLLGSFTDKGVFELIASSGELNLIHLEEGRLLNCPSVSPDGEHVAYDDRSKGGGVVIARRKPVE